MRRTVLAALAAALAATVLLMPSPAQAVTATTYQHQAFVTSNHQRAVHGRHHLKQGRCLHRYAVRQAQRMANQHRIFHQRLRPVLRACGLELVGENVASGFPNGRAVVNQGWMKSAPHRRNLLDKRFRVLSIGARKGSDGVWYASQLLGRH